jgi:hypothetical protein
MAGLTKPPRIVSSVYLLTARGDVGEQSGGPVIVTDMSAI